MTIPPVIGLYSPAPGCGKSTLATALVSTNTWLRSTLPTSQFTLFEVCPFAAPLKQLTMTLLLYAGVNHIDAHRFTYYDKEEIIPVLGVSARHIQRTLGTEWGRTCVSPDIWIRLWREHIRSSLNSGHTVLVDDVRFPNEADTIRALGGEVWCLTRPGIEASTLTHASDTSLADYPHFAHTLVNCGTRQALRDLALGRLNCPLPPATWLSPEVAHAPV